VAITACVLTAPLSLFLRKILSAILTQMQGGKPFEKHASHNSLEGINGVMVLIVCCSHGGDHGSAAVPRQAIFE
jgi:hypothetical protein